MKKFSTELIIWDFDGVIADSEILWLENRRQMINEKFRVNWDIFETNYAIGGMSDKTRRIVLDLMGMKTNDDFWQKALSADYDTMKVGIPLMDGVTEIFEMPHPAQCIATGGSRSKTMAKLQTSGVYKYFSLDKVFTADMVEHGKPEPDLFLLAAREMNVKPQNCLVIEDSLPGMKAAKRAGMDVIAFNGSRLNQTVEFLEKVRELKIHDVFKTMSEVKKYIKKGA